MEMHQLRYVVAVARAGTFSRAAEQCHVAQPSLSQQVQKLEEELGERLFERLKREARLTPAGETFLRRAVRILDEVDAAQREAQETRELVRGTVHAGVLPTIAPFLLPPVLAEFGSAFPGLEVVIHEDTTARLLQQLRQYELDFAVTSLPLDDDTVAIRPLGTEELLVAVPPDHVLARRRHVRASDLDAERFILLHEGHCLGDQILQFCDRRDLRPRVRFRTAQLSTIQALVRIGLGVSLVPAMATGERGPGAPVYRRLTAPRPVRQIVAIWPRQRPPGRAASNLLDVITRCLPAVTSAGKDGAMTEKR